MKRNPVVGAMAAVVGVVAMMPLHLGHGEHALDQTMPRPLMWFVSRYEHLLMRSIDYLATRQWIYDNDLTRRAVDWTSRRVLNTINGEILTTPEAHQVVDSLFEAGCTVAIGTCPCRRARKVLSDTVPNNTDMVFGLWAEEYIRNYPGYYRRLGLDEAHELIDEFARCGFVHQIYGYHEKAGAAYVMCNCDREVCIPLEAQKRRGFDAFRKGRSRATVDPLKCLGTEECGACLERCPFDARVESSGRARVIDESCFGCGVCLTTCRGEATSLARAPGEYLVYVRNLVER